VEGHVWCVFSRPEHDERIPKAPAAINLHCGPIRLPTVAWFCFLWLSSQAQSLQGAALQRLHHRKPFAGCVPALPDGDGKRIVFGVTGLFIFSNGTNQVAVAPGQAALFYRLAYP
jgi:hypothetical protein